MSRRLLDALNEIRPRVSGAPYLLLALKFGGILAPTVDDPALASLYPGTEELLQAIADQPDTSVAVFSGRERADLQARIRLPGLIYAGNHGLEISGPGVLFVEPAAAGHRDALQELSTALSARLQPIPGVQVEDKGLSLTVHYREAAEPDLEEVRRVVNSVLAGSNHPFQLTQAEKQFEIRPRLHWNKGAATLWIREQLGHPDALVVYLGSDVTDEEAFKALADQITARVGPATETAASYRLDGPPEVQEFLRWQTSLRPKALSV
jgi:trehalose 6-phosphate phosphatase